MSNRAMCCTEADAAAAGAAFHLCPSLDVLVRPQLRSSPNLTKISMLELVMVQLFTCPRLVQHAIAVLLFSI